jgi:hypothetical protein
MKATFITNGEYRAVESINAPTYYLVGRKGMDTAIRLSKFIPEYAIEGKYIKIDGYGNPWVKAE